MFLFFICRNLITFSWSLSVILGLLKDSSKFSYSCSKIFQEFFLSPICQKFLYTSLRCFKNVSPIKKKISYASLKFSQKFFKHSVPVRIMFDEIPSLYKIFIEFLRLWKIQQWWVKFANFLRSSFIIFLK